MPGSEALSPRHLDKICKLACEAAAKAGKFQLKYYRKKLDVKEKAKSSLVTKVDIGSEELIKKMLSKAYPSFQFLGEESGTSGGDEKGNIVWHVDPLDGTTNFVHGFPMFCVSIGLAVNHQPVMGVIHIPALNETFYGAQGLGAKFNGKKMKVSPRDSLRDCLLTTGFAYIADNKKLAPEITRFEKAHMEARAVRRPGAAAIDLAYVAAGIFDGFWERNLSSWDICAGSLLVQEAGGKVTDYKGDHFDLEGREILATNGLIHKKMEKILWK